MHFGLIPSIGNWYKHSEIYEGFLRRMCKEIVEINANTVLNKKEKLSGIDYRKGNYEARPHSDANCESFQQSFHRFWANEIHC